MRTIALGAIIILGFAAGIFIDHTFLQTANAAKKNVTIKTPPTVSMTVTAPTGKEIIKKQFNPDFVVSNYLPITHIPIFVSVPGTVKFNAQYMQLASARSAGRLNRIFVFEGQHVTQGEPLAEIYSPDYVSAQYEYLLAQQTLKTLQHSHDKSLISDSQSTLDAAKTRLINLGVWPQDITELEHRCQPSQYQFIRAPISGVVAKRNVDQGSYMNIGDNLMTIVNPDKLRFVGNVYEDNYAKVKLGQTVIVEAPALPNQQFIGTVNFVAPNIDPDTHTLPIYCDIKNPNGELRPDLFIEAKLMVGEQNAFLAPTNAIVISNNQSYVIIDNGHNEYQRQIVRAMKTDHHQMAICSGITGNEKIVTEGAVLINEMFGAS